MRSKYFLLTAATISLTIGAAGPVMAQSSSGPDLKRTETSQDRDHKQGQGTLNRTGAEDKVRSDNRSARDKEQSTGRSASGHSAPSTTENRSKDAAGNKSPTSAATSDNSGNSSPKQSTDSSKPSSTQSNTSQPSTAADQNRSQPSTASDSRSKEPSTAQQPAQNYKSATGTSTTQHSDNSTSQQNTRLSASLQSRQRTELRQAFAKVSVKPVTNVNFSISVGTAVPTSVTLHPVPTEVIAVIPQYRGYDFFVVRDEFVIVEPRTHKIVDVIERTGGSGASTTTTRRKLNLSQKERTYIREHAQARHTTTTGRAGRDETRIIVGEDAPEAVEIEEFPAEVYREVPAVKSYRYIHRGNDIYLVEPGSRRVIESFDED
jgi:hypothetical protein